MLISMGRSSSGTASGRDDYFYMKLSCLLGGDPFGVCMASFGYGVTLHS